MASSTKTAIAAVMALTVDGDHWPAWARMITSLIQLACACYLAWYMIAGPEPVELKQARR